MQVNEADLYERALAVRWPDSLGQKLVRWTKDNVKMARYCEMDLRSFLASLTAAERAELLGEAKQ